MLAEWISFLMKNSKKTTCSHVRQGFTLAEVLIAKREREKMSSLNLFRTRELKEPSNKFVKRCAFTLAEVLITLGIIGVVAAMTIPTLVKNYEKTQAESQLRKTYSQLSQFFKLLMADEGCNELMCTTLFDSGITDAEWQTKSDEIVRKYLKVVKSCITADTSCDETIKAFKGTATYTTQFAAAAKVSVFILADGTMFRMSRGTCAATTYPDISKIKNSCSWILVDINAQRAPNVFGKDVFGFGSLAQDGINYPDTSAEWAKSLAGDNWESYANYWRNASNQCGAPDQTIAQTAASTINGQNCLARIMENNWKIDYY